MDLWVAILTSLLIAVAIPVVFTVFWIFKLRGEKKLSFEGTVRTRSPRILSGFFLGFALLVLFGGLVGIIYCCVTDSENTTVWVVVLVSLGVTLFSGIGFFGYALVRFNYVVADNEGVRAYRLLRKTRYYRYEEIGSFKDTIWMGMLGGLIGYDKDGKKIFAIEAVHIGASAVAAKLREHKVKEKGQRQLTLK